MDQQGNSKIIITPTFYEVHGNPGTEIKLTGKITNNTEKNVKIDLSVRGVSIEALANEERLKFEDEKDSERISQWVNFENSSVTIDKNSTQTVKFTIKIPNGTKTKGYFPAIIYSYETTADNDTVDFSSELASVIFLDVKTEAEEKEEIKIGQINSFEVADKYVLSPKNEFKLEYQNTGNTYIHPRGFIEIYDADNQRLVNKITINDKFEYLLPSEQIAGTFSWEYGNEFSLIPKFGKYTAKIEILQQPGQTSPSIATENFYVVPVIHIFLFSILLVAISLLIIKFNLVKKSLKKIKVIKRAIKNQRSQ